MMLVLFDLNETTLVMLDKVPSFIESIREKLCEKKAALIG